MVVVLGIVSVLAGLAMAAYDAVGRRGALQSAAFDLQGVLSSARAKAVSRGYPVWVVFHPTAGRGSIIVPAQVAPGVPSTSVRRSIRRMVK